MVAGRLSSVVAAGRPATAGGVPLQADAGLALVVPSKYVVELLKRNGVAWTSA